MGMPEAAMNEKHGTVAWKHKVRAAGQLPVVQPVAQAARMQTLPHQHLGPGVAPADAAHVELALLRSEHVGHADPVASATIVLRHSRSSARLMPGRSVTAPKRNFSRYCGWNRRPGTGVALKSAARSGT